MVPGAGSQGAGAPGKEIPEELRRKYLDVGFATREARDNRELWASTYFGPLEKARCIHYFATGEVLRGTPTTKCVWYAVFYSENIFKRAIELALKNNDEPAAEELREAWLELQRLYREFLDAWNRHMDDEAAKKAREIAELMRMYEILDAWET